MGLDDAAHGLGPDQRRVPVEDQDGAAPSELLGRNLREGVAGPELLFLEDDGAATLQVRPDRRLGRRDDRGHVLDAGEPAGVEDEVDHGSAANWMQNLGPPGTDACTEAGG